MPLSDNRYGNQANALLGSGSCARRPRLPIGHCRWVPRLWTIFLEWAALRRLLLAWQGVGGARARNQTEPGKIVLAINGSVLTDGSLTLDARVARCGSYVPAAAEPAAERRSAGTAMVDGPLPPLARCYGRRRGPARLASSALGFGRVGVTAELAHAGPAGLAGSEPAPAAAPHRFVARARGEKAVIQGAARPTSLSAVIIGGNVDPHPEARIDGAVRPS